jgi:NADPH:quinone reductase-like Zn-dependent oxidoreductase
MRAAVIDELGGALRIEWRPIPAPRRGEVLVRVAAVTQEQQGPTR